MKTSKVKVKQQDIKQGIIIYVVHPVYGIDKYTVLSKPYQNRNIGLFAHALQHLDNHSPIKTTISLNDSGIMPLRYSNDTYNGRRTFKKLKHAKEWMKKWSTQQGFIKQHKLHEQEVAEWDDWDFDILGE